VPQEEKPVVEEKAQEPVKEPKKEPKKEPVNAKIIKKFAKKIPKKVVEEPKTVEKASVPIVEKKVVASIVVKKVKKVDSGPGKFNRNDIKPTMTQAKIIRKADPEEEKRKAAEKKKRRA
jgi:hypothetical protein